MLRGLTRGNTALVIVDFQERLLKIMDETVTRRSLFSINLLVRMFKRWNMPIVVTEQYPRGLGATSSRIQEHLGEAPIIEKMTFSCCKEPAFRAALGNSARPNIVLVGMETHVCVLQTAQDLIHDDYRVLVPLDAVQSSSKARWRNGLDLLRESGAVIANSESLIFQLMTRCDDPDFKYFSSLLKEQYE